MNSDPSTAYRRRPGLNAVAMDGELVMMGMEQGEYYGLRDVAATIWEALGEARTLDELCVSVSAEYDVAPETCRPDVSAFLDEMLAKKLIDRVD
jgi:Coenzyme PQQ synthesis protein D (PqqD)